MTEEEKKKGGGFLCRKRASHPRTAFLLQEILFCIMCWRAQSILSLGQELKKSPLVRPEFVETMEFILSAISAVCLDSKSTRFFNKHSWNMTGFWKSSRRNVHKMFEAGAIGQREQVHSLCKWNNKNLGRGRNGNRSEVGEGWIRGCIKKRSDAKLSGGFVECGQTWLLRKSALSTLELSPDEKITRGERWRVSDKEMKTA